MIRVRIRSANKYGWLGAEMGELMFFIAGDDGTNYLKWPASDIERIGEF